MRERLRGKLRGKLRKRLRERGSDMQRQMRERKRERDPYAIRQKRGIGRKRARVEERVWNQTARVSCKERDENHRRRKEKQGP